MPALLKELKENLGPEQMELIGVRIKTDSKTVRNGINLILPILLGAMTGKALQTEGQRLLYQTLTADHSGNIFANISKFLNNHDYQASKGILTFLLGDNRSTVALMVKEKSGIEPHIVNQLYELSSVLLMGFVSKELRYHQLDAEGLAVFLQRGCHQVAKQSPALYRQLNTMFKLEPPKKKSLFSFLGRKKK